MRNILITGIEGFVGTHFAEFLAQCNYKISGIYFAAPSKKIGKLYKCDIRDYTAVRDIIRKVKPEVIFHLAAQSSVFHGEKNIRDTYAINVQGTLNILEAAKELNIKPRIIYISSCDVYGIGYSRFTEQSATRPVSFYAMSKLCAEQACLYYKRAYGFNIVILRPFTHTGPGQSENFIFPRIAKRVAEIEADRQKPMLKLGNIKVKRDYADISDIVRAYELAIRKCKSGEIYNITSQKSYTIKQGIEYLVKLSHKKIAFCVDQQLLRKNDIPLMTGSAKKFMRQTGWKSKIGFYTTLTNFLNYYRAKIK